MDLPDVFVVPQLQRRLLSTDESNGFGHKIILSHGYITYNLCEHRDDGSTRRVYVHFPKQYLYDKVSKTLE